MIGKMVDATILLLQRGPGKGGVKKAEAFHLAGRDHGRFAVADDQGIVGIALQKNRFRFALGGDENTQSIIPKMVVWIHPVIKHAQNQQDPGGNSEQANDEPARAAGWIRNCSRGIHWYVTDKARKQPEAPP